MKENPHPPNTWAKNCGKRGTGVSLRTKVVKRGKERGDNLLIVGGSKRLSSDRYHHISRPGWVQAGRKGKVKKSERPA